jgi:D-alanyl-D-alanine carboxypeptidase (penicillin-binding protein 5/6)
MRYKNAAFLLFIILYLFCPAGLFASPDLNLNVRAAIMMNADTGRILYAQDADRQIPPASLTKILSLYLINEAVEQGRIHWQDNVYVSKKAGRTGGSRMFIQSGTQVKLEDLVKGMAVMSANDASVAAAEYVGGTDEEFVARMNRKAHELGMRNSLFLNPNGLPAKGQTTTARDILTLTLNYIHRFPQVMPIHAMQYYSYNNINQHNRNNLLKIYPEVDGLKTGFICESGYHIIITAKRGNTRLIAVVMGAQTRGIRTREMKKLLEAGFKMVDDDVSNMASRAASFPAERRNIKN